LVRWELAASSGAQILLGFGFKGRRGLRGAWLRRLNRISILPGDVASALKRGTEETYAGNPYLLEIVVGRVGGGVELTAGL